MFITLVSLIVFYVALKMGWEVLGPVMGSYKVAIGIATVVYFAVWVWGRRMGVRHFGGSLNNVQEGFFYIWLRDSTFPGALMVYLGIGFVVGGAYLLFAHHPYMALMYGVVGIGLVVTMVRPQSEGRMKRGG